jgi:hypothetical protein
MHHHQQPDQQLLHLHPVKAIPLHPQRIIRPEAIFPSYRDQQLLHLHLVKPIPLYTQRIIRPEAIFPSYRVPSLFLKLLPLQLLH